MKVNTSIVWSVSMRKINSSKPHLATIMHIGCMYSSYEDNTYSV